MNQLKIALLQSSFVIGNPMHNAKHLDKLIRKSIADGAELIVTPEDALSGYLPEDLLYRDDHYQLVIEAFEYIKNQAYPITLFIGLPFLLDDKLMNRAIILQNGKEILFYDKQCLPNYRVFDEKRYFTAGKENKILTINDIRIGVFICEDLWHHQITDTISNHKIDLIISLNASPYYIDKEKKRLNIFSKLAKEKQLPIAYVNCVGAQDSIVFDGGSFIMNANGEICALAPLFKEFILTTTAHHNNQSVTFNKSQTTELSPSVDQLIDALALGIKTYVSKNNFRNGVLIGLSGGIDSAVTLALAVLALGADKVQAVYMPSRFNADISEIDAKQQADALGVDFSIIPIENLKNNFIKSLMPSFNNLPEDVTEENLQARIRGVLLMALSNKLGKLLLTTGNKSEYAVGYATLYGDMCGGYAPIKDLYKTQVYDIAKALNLRGDYIPERVITREPSAELSENQFDQQSLPPYDVLDNILKQLIEQDQSISQIVKSTGYDKQIVEKVFKLVMRNEYKRQQSAPGPRISTKAFGRDRRYPISVDIEGLLKS